MEECLLSCSGNARHGNLSFTLKWTLSPRCNEKTHLQEVHIEEWSKKYDDIIETWDDMPTGWWLEHHSIVHVLAVMVHCQSPTFIAAAAHAEPGPTHDEQRAAITGSIAAERRIESSKCHPQEK